MLFHSRTGKLLEPMTGRTWDQAAIGKQVAARRACYREAGLESGDRVLINFGNRIEFFADLLAIWHIGACPIPVDSRLTPYELGVLAGAAQPKFLLTLGPLDDELRETFATRRIPMLDSEAAGDHEPASGRDVGFRLDQEALILFTSGTTGDPKGVVHTHRSLLAKWQSLDQSLDLANFERTLCLLPTHFGHGLICNCLFPWLAGCDLHVVPPSDQEVIMNLGGLIDSHDITFLSSVPSIWRFALRVSGRPEKDTLRSVHCGSAPLTAHLWNQIRDWCGTPAVYNAYGITETGSWIAGTTLDDFEPDDGLIGAPWGSRILITATDSPDETTHLREPFPAGETGFVWLKTPALMQGYLDRDDLTAQVVSNGWFMTGDLGMVDDRGRLYLRGRKRDEINKGGMKVYPSDIDAVAERFENAHDCCAFPYDDPHYGQNVGVALVLEPGDDETIKRLYAWMKRHLGEHQMPVRWYLLDSIPRTSRGKINRDQVAATCSELDEINLRQLLS